MDREIGRDPANNPAHTRILDDRGVGAGGDGQRDLEGERDEGDAGQHGAADAADGLDIAVDGADQFTPTGLDLIKGLGRCALREMVVARLARRFVIVVGPGKRVTRLGEAFADGRPMRLPVEVVPFAEPFVARGIERLGLEPEPWCVDGRRGLTDNGNHVLDCRMDAVDDPAGLDRAIRGLPGVVGTGFFLAMADRVLEGDASFRLIAEHVRGAVAGGVNATSETGPRGRQPR